MKKASRMTVLIPWLICALGALFYSYEYFLRITPSVMTTELKSFFHIQDGALGSLSAYYYYIYTPMQLVVGLLMDRYGPRRLLTVATLSCVIGSILFASTPILFVAEMGRLLIGFGSAFAFVGVLKLATIWLPGRYFAMFAGLATALGMFGAILGDNIMTALKLFLGWQETVLISAAFGVVIALLIGLFVRDQVELDRKVKNTNITFKETTIGLAQIIKTPQFWIVGLIGAFLYLPISVFAELWGVPFLKGSFHFSNQAAAFAISMVFLGGAIGGPIYGWISDRLHRRSSPMVVAGLLAALMISILLFGKNLPIWSIYTLLFLFGFAASGENIVFAVGKELGQAKFAGSSIAFVNFTVMLGGALLQPILGYVLEATHTNYQIALVAIPIGLVFSAILSRFILRETYCKQIIQPQKAENTSEHQTIVLKST